MADTPHQASPHPHRPHKGLAPAALAVRDKAYAPYSNFAVGAAVLGTDGIIYTGCNVENAAYPEGLCAEANAIAAMVAGGCQNIAQVFIIKNGKGLITPCGGCRQKINEFANADTPIFVYGENDDIQTYNLTTLLPLAFGRQDLNKTGK